MSKCLGIRIGVAAFVLLTVAAFASSASADLVAYYNFDDGSGTMLTNSGTGGSILNGTVSGATWTTSKPGYGGALSFNGSSDYAVVADNAALNFTNTQSFTAMAWVYADATQQAGDWHTVFAKGRESWGGNFWGSYYNTITGDATFSSVGGWTTIEDAASTGTWYHVAIVQDVANSKEYLYLNGDCKVTYDGTGNHNDAGNLYFGAWLSGTTFYEGFKGQIDEFKLFNTALDGSQIKSAMTIPEPSTIILLGSALTGLLCYAWRKRK